MKIFARTRTVGNTLTNRAMNTFEKKKSLQLHFWQDGWDWGGKSNKQKSQKPHSHFTKTPYLTKTKKVQTLILTLLRAPSGYSPFSKSSSRLKPPVHEIRAVSQKILQVVCLFQSWTVSRVVAVIDSLWKSNKHQWLTPEIEKRTEWETKSKTKTMAMVNTRPISSRKN